MRGGSAAADFEGLKDWTTLKKAVESRFGLSHKALVDAFYNMHIAEGQELGPFILHVEDMRACLNIDSQLLFLNACPKTRISWLDQSRQLWGLCCIDGGARVC